MQAAFSDKSPSYKHAPDSLEFIFIKHQFILRILELYSLLASHFFLSEVHFYYYNHGNLQ